MVSEEPTRKATKRFKAAGFTPQRTTGSHTVWAKGSVSVTIPDGHRVISPGVVRQINNAIKEAGK
jgi:predicted RNA binding protein YcfA (HicA-like mRNA interferase family)